VGRRGQEANWGQPSLLTLPPFGEDGVPLEKPHRQPEQAQIDESHGPDEQEDESGIEKEQACHLREEETQYGNDHHHAQLLRRSGVIDSGGDDDPHRDR